MRQIHQNHFENVVRKFIDSLVSLDVVHIYICQILTFERMINWKTVLIFTFVQKSMQSVNKNVKTIDTHTQTVVPKSNNPQSYWELRLIECQAKSQYKIIAHELLQTFYVIKFLATMKWKMIFFHVQFYYDVGAYNLISLVVWMGLDKKGGELWHSVLWMWLLLMHLAQRYAPGWNGGCIKLSSQISHATIPVMLLFISTV